MTMADIARHAEVSRATLYRRWPNVQAVVAALMTREWTTALVSAFQPDAAAPGPGWSRAWSRWSRRPGSTR